MVMATATFGRARSLCEAISKIISEPRFVKRVSKTKVVAGGKKKAIGKKKNVIGKKKSKSVPKKKKGGAKKQNKLKKKPTVVVV